MCRFIAYLGQPLLMDDILSKPVNSLVNQSQAARELEHPMNADGFGVGWYNHEVDPTPGLFKSIQPAWNDLNLLDVFAKVKSTCFFGHVRAASAGDVAKANCHPFRYQQYLMMHNGGIGGFNNIKRLIREELSQPVYDWVKGQTDTEHFYALFIHNLLQESQHDLTSMVNALVKTVHLIEDLQNKVNNDLPVFLNCVVTDGCTMVALRHTTDPDQPPSSLHYSQGEYECKNHKVHMCTENDEAKSIIVASERLNDFPDEWQDVPPSHLLMINNDLTINLQPLPDR